MDLQELKAVIAARRELGPEHEEHLVEGFLERLDREIDRRVDAKLAQRKKSAGRQRLGIFVPIFLFAGIFGGAQGIIAASVALVVVFAVSELRR